MTKAWNCFHTIMAMGIEDWLVRRNNGMVTKSRHRRGALSRRRPEEYGQCRNTDVMEGCSYVAAMVRVSKLLRLWGGFFRSMSKWRLPWNNVTMRRAYLRTSTSIQDKPVDQTRESVMIHLPVSHSTLLPTMRLATGRVI